MCTRNIQHTDLYINVHKTLGYVQTTIKTQRMLDTYNAIVWQRKKNKMPLDSIGYVSLSLLLFTTAPYHWYHRPRTLHQHHHHHFGNYL